MASALVIEDETHNSTQCFFDEDLAENHTSGCCTSVTLINLYLMGSQIWSLIMFPSLLRLLRSQHQIYGPHLGAIFIFTILIFQFPSYMYFILLNAFDKLPKSFLNEVSLWQPVTFIPVDEPVHSLLWVSGFSPPQPGRYI